MNKFFIFTVFITCCSSDYEYADVSHVPISDNGENYLECISHYNSNTYDIERELMQRRIYNGFSEIDLHRNVPEKCQKYVDIAKQ